VPVSIARSTLRRETRRYVAALLSVTFAGLLMLVQLALLQGLFASVTVPLDRSSAPLWLGFPNLTSVDVSRPLTVHAPSLALIHPDVEQVEPYALTGGDLRRLDGVAMFAAVHVIDTAPNAMAFSRLLTGAQRALLDEPGALLIDRADLDKVGGSVGMQVEINGKKAHIAGVLPGGLRAGCCACAPVRMCRRWLDPWGNLVPNRVGRPMPPMSFRRPLRPTGCWRPVWVSVRPLACCWPWWWAS